MAVTIHPSAILDEGAQLGDGTRVWHWVHVCAGAKLGKDCVLGQNVFVGSDVVIGDNVRIQNNVSIYDAVTLEDDVFCGPSMVFTNVYNPRSHMPRKTEYRRTLIRRGASIGANATVVCGYTVGQYACFKFPFHLKLRANGRLIDKQFAAPGTRPSKSTLRPRVRCLRWKRTS